MRAAQAKWGRLSEHVCQGYATSKTSSSVFKSVTACRTGRRCGTWSFGLKRSGNGLKARLKPNGN